MTCTNLITSELTQLPLPVDHAIIADWKKMFGFLGMIEIVRKVNLGRSLDIMRKLFPEEYSFHPQQWFLPQQYADFSDACRRMNEKVSTKNRPVFIVKPDEGSQGDGIYLIQVSYMPLTLILS